MKFIILSLAFAALTLASCEGTSADIEVDSLETACDHIYAMDEVATEMLDLRGMDEAKDLEGDTKAKYEKLEKKIKEIEDALQDKYKRSDVKDCPDFDIVRRKMKDL